MQRVHKTIDTKSRRICSVPQCTTYCTDSTSLHVFPLEPELREIWRQTLRIKKPISKYMEVCSKHFLAEDFFHDTENTKRRRLRKGRVPSQNLPVEKMFQHEANNDELQEAKPIERVMLFSQEDLLASDEYDKLLQGSSRDEEPLIYSDQSHSPIVNEISRDDDEESTKRSLQLPSGYDKLLVVKYEEEIKPKKRRPGRPKSKIFKHENAKTGNNKPLRSNTAKNKSFDKYGQLQTRNGARRGRPVGSKNEKLKKVQISDDYYDLLNTSSTYNEKLGIRSKISHTNNRPHWYVEFVDKGTQTDCNNEKHYIESKYINRSTQTTTYVENS